MYVFIFKFLFENSIFPEDVISDGLRVQNKIS